jgi:hypothetical protein
MLTIKQMAFFASNISCFIKKLSDFSSRWTLIRLSFRAIWLTGSPLGLTTGCGDLQNNVGIFNTMHGSQMYYVMKYVPVFHCNKFPRTMRL